MTRAVPALLAAVPVLLALSCGDAENSASAVPVATPQATPTTAAAARTPATATTVATTAASPTQMATATPVATPTTTVTASARENATDPDRAALVALYTAAGGANWRNSANWLTRTPLREWHGVETSTAGRVTELSLDENGLRGPIPPEMGNLAELRVLSLTSNSLTGPIPAELANLWKLEDLALGGNTFTGCVPYALLLVARSDAGDLGLERCGDPPPMTFTYNTYDTTGEAREAGSHALLTDAGATGSVADSSTGLRTAEAIIVNVSDSDGASHVAFYSSITVGDVVEWYPNGYEDCWMRYKITALLPDPPDNPPRKRFAVEWLYVAHLTCVDDVLTDDLEVELRWNPPSARPDPGGGPAIMLADQPVPGGATYRVAPHSPLLIDVPEGMNLVRYTGFVLAGARVPVGLEDVATGSYILLDNSTGEELRRLIQTVEGHSRDVGALFDQIVASVRVEGE